MKIATWNINSVRLRRDLVKQFLDASDVDILCLQETKTEDKTFPADFFAEAGWAHQAIRGEKSYNGVAILSRTPLDDVTHMNWAGKDDCRHISARTESGVIIHNFYVPAGGDIADPEFSSLDDCSMETKPGSSLQKKVDSSLYQLWLQVSFFH